MRTSLGTAPKMFLRSRMLSFFLRHPSVGDIDASTFACAAVLSLSKLTSPLPHCLWPPGSPWLLLHCHRSLIITEGSVNIPCYWASLEHLVADNSFWKDTPFSGVDSLLFPLSLSLLDFQAPPFHMHVLPVFLSGSFLGYLPCHSTGKLGAYGEFLKVTFIY